MSSPLETAIRDHLTHYVAGDISLDEFKDWFVGAIWDVEATNDPVTIDFAYEIMLNLAEQSSEHFPETELRERLLLSVVETSNVPEES